MKNNKQQWYKTRLALAGAAVIRLAAAYFMASLAIDTASLWAYAATIILTVLGLRFAYDAIKGVKY